MYQTLPYYKTRLHVHALPQTEDIGVAIILYTYTEQVCSNFGLATSYPNWDLLISQSLQESARIVPSNES